MAGLPHPSAGRLPCAPGRTAGDTAGGGPGRHVTCKAALDGLSFLHVTQSRPATAGPRTHACRSPDPPPAPARHSLAPAQRPLRGPHQPALLSPQAASSPPPRGMATSDRGSALCPSSLSAGGVMLAAHDYFNTWARACENPPPGEWAASPDCPRTAGLGSERLARGQGHGPAGRCPVLRVRTQDPGASVPKRATRPDKAPAGGTPQSRRLFPRP